MALVVDASSKTVYFTLSGKLQGSLAREIVKRLEEEISVRGKIIIAVDTEAVTSYESEFREIWLQWLQTNAARFQAVAVLVSSRVVQMGVNISKLVLRAQLEGFSDRAKMIERIQRDDPGFETPKRRAAD